MADAASAASAAPAPHLTSVETACGTVRVAVWGCGHGELDRVYAALECVCAHTCTHARADLLICCGDFQAVRNEADLACMSCPDKYKAMRSFYKYYSGERVATTLTLLVGGNHEAANHLQELPYGGWVAPNIYYLGTSGVVNFRGLRIAGVSGIYKRYNFREGYHEAPPYTADTLRSVFHVREFDYFKLKHVQQPIDIFVSHDWPMGVYNFGNTAALQRSKRFMADEIARNELGNPAHTELMQVLQPRFWFSAHLHVKFSATVSHPPRPGRPAGTPNVTRFLALDKCLPGRAFLQLIDVPVSAHATAARADVLCYDAEWLAVLRRTHGILPVAKRYPPLPAPIPMTEAEVHHARALWAASLGVSPAAVAPLRIPENFVLTVLPYRPPFAGAEDRTPAHMPMPEQHGNPQMDVLLQMLRLRHRHTIPCFEDTVFEDEEQESSRPWAGHGDPGAHTWRDPVADPAALDIDDMDAPLPSMHVVVHDPAELPLEDDGMCACVPPPPLPPPPPPPPPHATARADPAEIALDDV